MKTAAVLATMLFALNTFAARPLLFEPVKGSCPKITKKETFVCDNADGVQETTVDLSTFPANASKEVKTKTQTCDKVQSELLLKHLSKDLSQVLSAGHDLEVISCTSFLDGEKSSNIFLIEVAILKKKDNVEMGGPWKTTLLAKRNGLSIEPLHSYNSETSYETEEYSVQAVCDTDGDNRADIIMKKQNYGGGEKILIFKNSIEKSFSAASLVFDGTPSCGC